MRQVEPVSNPEIVGVLFHRKSASFICTGFLTLICLLQSASAEPEPWVVTNSERLLSRVAAAPRLSLEMSELHPKAPTNEWELGMVSSVAAGPDGLIYALHRNLEVDPVTVFDTDGNVVRSWGRGLFTIPHSIRIDPEGNVWTVDAGSSHIYKFSPDGERLLHIDVGEMPDDDRRFRGAADIAFASDGNLFIADGYGNARVLEYDSNGRRLHQWGAAGNGPGEFQVVHGIAIDQNDAIYVADRQNGRIQRFSRDGKLLGIWDGLGQVFSLYFDGDVIWAGTNRLDHPNSAVGWVMQLDPDDGNLVGVVAVPWSHSITVNSSGEFLIGLTPNRVLWYRSFANK